MIIFLANQYIFRMDAILLIFLNGGCRGFSENGSRKKKKKRRHSVWYFLGKKFNFMFNFVWLVAGLTRDPVIERSALAIGAQVRINCIDSLISDKFEHQ